MSRAIGEGRKGGHTYQLLDLTVTALSTALAVIFPQIGQFLLSLLPSLLGIRCLLGEPLVLLLQLLYARDVLAVDVWRRLALGTEEARGQRPGYGGLAEGGRPGFGLLG
jgi:hypothetical protein